MNWKAWAVVTLVVSGVAFGARSVKSEEEEAPDEVSAAVEEKPLLTTEHPRDVPLIALSTRIDAQFTAGAPAGQGFSLPSVRLAAAGQIQDFIDYKLALGQTREFTTALLPQIMPVEAFINLASGRSGPLSAMPTLSWKFGMFTPQYNPLWSPDLSDIDLPDYGRAHQTLLISRDLGTQLAYESGPQGFSIGVGAFNGNGILGGNSNNSKAFTGFVREEIPFEGGSVAFGGAAYASGQSTRGALNFKSNWVSNLYGQLYVRSLRLSVYADFLYGSFENNTAAYKSVGGSAVVTVGFTEWFRLFARYESVDHPPTSGNYLRHYQFGPILDVAEELKVFLLYDYADEDTGGPESSAQIRMRLTI